MPSVEFDLNRKELALWLFHEYEPDHGILNIPVALRFPHRLRWWPVHTALQHLIGRHPALRTLFPNEDGTPGRQVLDPGDPRTAVKVEPIAVTAGSLDADLRAFAGRPFDLTTDLPVRAAHLTGEDVGDVLCLVLPHIVVDARSTRVLADELIELYGHLSADRPIPDRLVGPVERFVEPPPAEESIRYWREQLAGAADSGRPLDLARSDGPTDSFTGGHVRHPLSAGATRALASISAELRVTENVVLLNAYHLLLARHGAGDDIVVGSPLDARDAAAGNSIGYHVNIVGIRARVDPASTFRRLVAAGRDVFLAALLHSGASIDEIFPGAYDGADGRPLFRYMFNYLPPEVQAGRDSFAQVPVHTGFSRLDLDLLVFAVRGGGAVLEARYNDHAFRATDVRTLLDRFDALLVGLDGALDRPLRDLPADG
ncbi:condensation domain-containing protein [Plantactinospora sp. CA-290183]|uniref:condensation domain-containing protein n=1 Tax=Plantactinospora sp. CA-290183 TaxID=3240006 RepID=UPI003D91D9EF